MYFLNKCVNQYLIMKIQMILNYEASQNHNNIYQQMKVLRN